MLPGGQLCCGCFHALSPACPVLTQHCSACLARPLPPQAAHRAQLLADQRAGARAEKLAAARKTTRKETKKVGG